MLRTHGFFIFFRKDFPVADTTAPVPNVIEVLMETNMKNVLSRAVYYAELALVLPVLFYWYYSGSLLNPVAIVLLLVLLGQFFFKNTVSGIVIPIVIIALVLFMLLALQSEFFDFKVFGGDARRLLAVGGGYLSVTLAMAVAMFFKYFKRLMM